MLRSHGVYPPARLFPPGTEIESEYGVWLLEYLLVSFLPRRKAKPSAQHLLWVSRRLAIVFGIVQIGVGVAGQWLNKSVVESVTAIATFAIGVVLSGNRSGA